MFATTPVKRSPIHREQSSAEDTRGRRLEGKSSRRGRPAYEVLVPLQIAALAGHRADLRASPRIDMPRSSARLYVDTIGAASAKDETPA